MTQAETRTKFISSIDDVIRQITWQSHKQLLQTLSRPEISLTLPQMVTLFAIRAAGTCRMSELAETTQQSAGTLTGIVDRLIEDNLVGRVRDTDDRRVVQVTLTPHGQERLSRVEQARLDDMERILQRFEFEHLIELDGILRQLLAGIHEQLNNDALNLNNGANHAGSNHAGSNHRALTPSHFPPYNS